MSELNVKAGDRVIVTTKYNGKQVRTVEKITPSGLIKVNGVLYLKNGYQRGADAWSRNYISECTEEEITLLEQELFAKKVVRALNELSHLTYEQAVAISQIVELQGVS